MIFHFALGETMVEMIMPGDCVHCIMFHAGGSGSVMCALISPEFTLFTRSLAFHPEYICVCVCVCVFVWLNNFIAFGYGFICPA